jgi:asparagine synthase (glutamine-hydrolysing)
VIDHEAAAAGVEMRMPFLDLDLLELAVTVPATRKWQKGVTRVIQREAFADVLPESVRTRIMKHNFGTKIWDSMVARDGPIIAETLARHGHLLADPAQLAEIQASWDAMRQGGDIDSLVALRIWRVVVTLRWLAGEGQKSGDMCAA